MVYKSSHSHNKNPSHSLCINQDLVSVGSWKVSDRLRPHSYEEPSHYHRLSSCLYKLLGREGSSLYFKFTLATLTLPEILHHLYSWPFLTCGQQLISSASLHPLPTGFPGDHGLSPSRDLARHYSVFPVLTIVDGDGWDDRGGEYRCSQWELEDSGVVYCRATCALLKCPQ